jgi:hypothetical protein
MRDILQLVEYLKGYVASLETATHKFLEAMPVHTRQHMKRLANKKLDSTKDTYLDALRVRMTNYVLVVSLDQDNWLANAVETGVGGFDLKAGHLASPKAKMSKQGFRYMRIPIGKDPQKQGGTKTEQNYRQRIIDILIKPRFGTSQVRTNRNGGVYESQKVIHTDPSLQGFYRTRQFDSADDFYSGKKKPKWEYVLFRTMSENPLSQSAWNHPGIKPVHIFRDTERWLEQSVGHLFEDFVQSELESFNQRFSENK